MNAASVIFVRSSNPGAFLVWCALGCAIGIVLFFQGFRLLLRRRLILDTPFSKIRSASMGMVEVSGLAVGPYVMTAPITSRPCYFYRTLVWEYKQRGKNKQWVKVAGECMHLPFFVDDNTARLLVDPRGADLDIHRDFEEQFCDSFFSTKDPMPGSVRSFLSRHGVQTSNKIKVQEYCIKPKNSLFILGTLAANPGIRLSPEAICDNDPPNSSFTQPLSLSSLCSFSSLRVGAFFSLPAQANREAGFATEPSGQAIAETATKSWDATGQQKVAAALMKAGISNPAAWSAAGAGRAGVGVAAVQIMERSPETRAGEFDPNPPVLLMKGAKSDNFLISWRSQQDVARALGWKCTLMIWGGPALVLLSLYFLLSLERLL